MRTSESSIDFFFFLLPPPTLFPFKFDSSATANTDALFWTRVNSLLAQLYASDAFIDRRPDAVLLLQLSLLTPTTAKVVANVTGYIVPTRTLTSSFFFSPSSMSAEEVIIFSSIPSPLLSTMSTATACGSVVDVMTSY